jgi:hypothetical protein
MRPSSLDRVARCSRGFDRGRLRRCNYPPILIRACYPSPYSQNPVQQRGCNESGSPNRTSFSIDYGRPARPREPLRERLPSSSTVSDSGIATGPVESGIGRANGRYWYRYAHLTGWRCDLLANWGRTTELGFQSQLGLILEFEIEMDLE